MWKATVIGIALAAIVPTAFANVETGVGTGREHATDSASALERARQRAKQASKGVKQSDQVAATTSDSWSKGTSAGTLVGMDLNAATLYLPVVAKLEQGGTISRGVRSTFHEACQLISRQPTLAVPYGQGRSGNAGAFERDMTGLARCALAYGLVAEESIERMAMLAFENPREVEAGAPGIMEEIVAEVLNDKAVMRRLNGILSATTCSVSASYDVSAYLPGNPRYGNAQVKFNALAIICDAPAIGRFTLDPKLWTAEQAGVSIWGKDGGFMGKSLKVAVSGGNDRATSLAGANTTSKSRDRYKDENASVSSTVASKVGGGAKTSVKGSASSSTKTGTNPVK